MNSRNIGEYEVLEKLGEGGMGAVYKARHLRTQQLVAIKVASRAVLADSTLSRRFELEFSDAATADPRSDVYSLAATFYSCIIGEFPFGKGSMTEIVQRKLKNQFEAPIKRLPTLRPSVDAAIRLAMHADPKNRPVSIGDF